MDEVKILTGSMLLEEYAAIHCDPDRDHHDLEREVIKRNCKWSGLNDADKDTKRKDYYYKLIRELPDPDGQSAICLSGGGIRSAAFALGVLQGLARHRLLSQSHYLSTVSGGGYIGAWLTAWAYRARNEKVDFASIEEKLATGGTDLKPLGELRRNQTFLTPHSGLASPDTWAAVALVIRNLLLNWLVFLPLLAALLLVPRILQAWLLYYTLAIPEGWDMDRQSSLVTLFQWMKELWTKDDSSRLFDNVQYLHFWLDAIGAMLIGSGMAYSMANRSSDSSQAINDRGFSQRVLLPVVVGIILLLFSTCFWFAGSVNKKDAGASWQWIVPSAVAFAFVVARLVAWVQVRRRENADEAHRRRHAEKQKDGPGKEGHDLPTLLQELLAQAAAGALVGALLWKGIQLGFTHLNDHRPPDFGEITVYGLPWFLMSFLAGQVLLAGLTSHLFGAAGDRNREWLARASGWYAAVALVWLAFAGVVIYGPQALDLDHVWKMKLLPLTVGSGLLSIAGGSSPLTKAISMATGNKRLRPNTVIAVLSIVFALCLSIWIAKATDWLILKVWHRLLPIYPDTLQATHGSEKDAGLQLAFTFGGFVLLLGFSALASRFVNVNYFSLNGLYRNRLVRAFLGASNIKGVVKQKPQRNPFEGSAPSDNPPMHTLWPSTNACGNALRPMPFPVVNMTLNLTATDNNAWQERKAAPFIATPLRVGGDFVGYRPARHYAGGLTLGTAMSISGAAASPNWGYHSSPVTSFLMALFNVRLGCWLGNPKRDDRWKWDGPRFGWQLFMQEALGRTTADDNFVYLSDGGHFDNLGLYEMVRRRCRIIVVSDAGADPDVKLEDLGNAVRKIAIDLDVSIEFDQIETRKRSPDMTTPGVYCAIGRIIYPKEGQADDPRERQTGTIIYIKAGIYDDVPADVRAYAAADARFPHDTTLNQWFTESQFESYRALGSHVIRMMTSPRNASGKIIRANSDAPLTMREFLNCVERYLNGYAGRSNKPVPVRLVS